MFRTIKLIFVLFTELIVTAMKLGKARRLKRAEKENELSRHIVKTTNRFADNLLKAAGAKVSVTGLENIPGNRAVVFAANHQSFFDVPVLIHSFRRPLAFVAKTGVAKVPILGNWMKYMRCVLVNRDDMRQSLRAINEAAKNIKKGYSMLIFPEGTRTKDGSIIPFKPGGLRIAKKANCEIIPVTLDGVFDIYEKNKGLRIKASDVRVTVSEAIDISSMDKKDIKGLDEKIREIISSKLRNSLNLNQI